MSLRRERAPAQASNTDLFGWIAACYTKEQPTGTAPTYMMHRFMASDPDLAQAARELQLYLREPDLIFRTWQGLLPRQRQAPRFAYIVAKKKPEEEELITRLKAVLSESRTSVETMVALVQLAGRERELYLEVGLKPPNEPEPKAPPRVKHVGPKPGQGLLANRR